jgi:hypothetical protein
VLPRRAVSKGSARLLLCAFALASSRARAADWTLARRGVPTAAIVTSAAARGEEQQAASELQGYLRKISGATLPIVQSAQRSSLVPTIRVGIFGADPVKEWRGERPSAQGFALQTQGNTLWIVGGDARGALYGVYELLDEVLGVRWFMPGDLGEDVPSQATMTLPRVNRTRAPAFKSVYGLTWGGGPGSLAWELRMRAKVGSASNFGHNWYKILPLTPANLAADPERFALFEGVRGRSSQLCSAYPDVVRISAQEARRHFDSDPGSPLFSISPNDGYGFCEDSRCRAVDALYGVTDGTISDRLVHYANEVLQDLERTHPGRELGILAYANHVNPPYRARPLPGYATLVTHMPWEFCHVHAIEDPACRVNPRFASYLRGWTALTRHSGVYEFYGHFFVPAPWPIVHVIRRDIPLFHSLGVERFTSETQQHWATQGLNFYVAAKLAWDPKLDVDRLLDDYFARFYGKAAPAMRRYWERWEQAMVATAAEGDGGYEWLRMFTPALVAETGAHLAEAERLAASDREKVARRVAFARTGHRFTEAYTQIIDYGLRGDIPAAMAAGEEALRRARATAGSEPQALYLYVVNIQVPYLMSIVSSGQAPWVFLRP